MFVDRTGAAVERSELIVLWPCTKTAVRKVKHSGCVLEILPSGWGVFGASASYTLCSWEVCSQSTCWVWRCGLFEALITPTLIGVKAADGVEGCQLLSAAAASQKLLSLKLSRTVSLCSRRAIGRQDRRPVAEQFHRLHILLPRKTPAASARFPAERGALALSHGRD